MTGFRSFNKLDYGCSSFLQWVLSIKTLPFIHVPYHCHQHFCFNLSIAEKL